ncbi:MAG: hypothetical protein HY889_06010 [Deltaproteobacteria bacterium]|nr:hypothetical protein [Deltaproteobacteria bacterium]
MKKNHDAAFKAKLALEAVKGEKTTARIASEYGVHPNRIGRWTVLILSKVSTPFPTPPLL